MPTIFSKNLLKPIHVKINLFDIFETVLYETDLYIIGGVAYQQTDFGATYMYLAHEQIRGYYTLGSARLVSRELPGKKKYLAGFSSNMALHIPEYIPQF